MTKNIFITGGVLSGVGKGVTAASIGALLKQSGKKVFVQKFDPYLNHDPGTMSPYQHGEVYVTQDGGETDLDLGHYERIIGDNFFKDSNYTTGSLYKEIFDEERRGLYKGATVQVLPHVVNKIKEKIINATKKHKPDFMIIEIGGTVGDIESQPYIHAISNFNPKKSLFIHTTYIPFLAAAKEHKSKPTQHSLSTLNSYGIFPNILILRSNTKVNNNITKKVANYARININNVINIPDVSNIYALPVFIEKSKLINTIEKHFKIKLNTDIKNLIKINKLINNKKKQQVTIGMIGKYIELEDSYLSIIESIKITSIYKKLAVNFKWMDASLINNKNVASKLNGCDGYVILPGFGSRGFNGKVIAATHLRSTTTPTLGICYGLQAMVISQAIIKGISNPITTEISKKGTPIVDIIEGKSSNIIGGTLRLGGWDCEILPNTIAKKIYKTNLIQPRHRHRYEINPKYINELEDNEFKFSGYNPQTKLVEIAECTKHPFYFGVQFHPEFSSTLLKSNPLFDYFMDVVKNKKN